MVSLPSFRNWHIINTDTGETVDGQFEGVAVTRNVTTSYQRTSRLNAQHPITQFLHGNADTLSFGGRIFRRDVLDGGVTESLDKLIAWTKRVEALGRPPIVLFYVGDGDPIYGDFFSVIDSVTDIVFDSPLSTGAVRGATFTVNLTQYTEFTLVNEPPPETRYARAKGGDYYELLAQREYGEPMLGDVVRKRHPAIQIVQAGQVIKLPSKEAIRSIPIAPTSIQLRGLTSRKSSPQKALREFHLDRLNRTRLSVAIPPGL